jgi:hypothetical protein
MDHPSSPTSCFVSRLVLARQDSACLHIRFRSRGRFDLAKFDVITADLDLSSARPEVLQRAVTAISGQVFAFIQARAAHAAESFRQKPLSSKLGSIQVTESHTDPADEQSAYYAPDATGCMFASRTYNCVFAIGRPMDTDLLRASAACTSWTQQPTTVSLGP